jgi:hypothetical protein
MRIIKNIGSDRVIDYFNSVLPRAKSIDLAPSQLSLAAWPQIRRTIRSSNVRLLLNQSVLGKAYLAGGNHEGLLRSELTMRGSAVDIATFIEERGDVRITPLPIMQSLITAEKVDQAGVAFQGSCSLDAAGLGLVPAGALSLIQVTETDQEAGVLQSWFDGAWQQTKPDGRDIFLERMRSIGQHLAPEQLYRLALLTLFSDKDGVADEERIMKSATGIRDTLVWKKLFAFQRDGVVGAIDKLEKIGGCIIADSVGLGKTFEALAVIKYYELRNDRVLVLCPKRLRDNWTLYKANDRRNVLAHDRFNYDVLNHTDLTREKGVSGDIDLDYLNWGNYDLVVIDESHNFRNKPNATERETRYERLMNRIIKAGVKTKVLMLSATPVNNRLNDLKNQIAFATEANDAALRNYGINSVETTVRLAQLQFNRWQDLPVARRTTSRLVEMLGFDYFKLLDLITIARSRRHIEKYYGTVETGKFPHRLKPLNPRPDVDTAKAFPSIAKINTELKRLRLAAYAPLRYVLPNRQNAYEARYATKLTGKQCVFKQADREESLINLIRMNLLKRMESSVTAFALTLRRQLDTTNGLIARLKAASDEIEGVSIEDVDFDDPAFEPLLVGRKIKVLLADADKRLWLQDLRDDAAQLTRLLAEAEAVTPSRDAKLQALKALISQKMEQPLNANNKKAIIFTAFADTAQYLYAELADWAKSKHGINVALVNGTGSNKTTLKGIRTDLTGILAAFSPRSKERPEDLANEGEIELLIATDCISEGQNLQDCDWLANYDIHWNPVRIIQRFGRIDRIGSKNDVIQLVNFWPNIELEEYIQLESRVSGRMVLLDISATGEENIIEQQSGDPMNDLEYRRNQMVQLQSQVIDLEELSGGMSITDMTLNDFRIELSGIARDEVAHLEEMLPTSHAIVAAQDGLPPGAIFCLKPVGKMAQTDQGAQLGGHFLVYVSSEGEAVVPHTQAKLALEALKSLTKGKSAPDSALTSAHDKETSHGMEMSTFQNLLARAVAAISGKEEERAVLSLFTAGGTQTNGAGGIEDYEIPAFLIIREGA